MTRPDPRVTAWLKQLPKLAIDGKGLEDMIGISHGEFLYCGHVEALLTQFVPALHLLQDIADVKGSNQDHQQRAARLLDRWEKGKA